MSTIRITKEFTFDMAHALAHYDGKCKNIHGHTYRLCVTISGKPVAKGTKAGMVMDFSDLKEIVSREILEPFDHSLALSQDDERFADFHGAPKVHLTPYQPTCENLLVDFVSRLNRNFTDGVSLKTVVLHETPTSYASWHAEDN